MSASVCDGKDVAPPMSIAIDRSTPRERVAYRSVHLTVIAAATVAMAILAAIAAWELHTLRLSVADQSTATLSAVRNLHVAVRDVEVTMRKTPAAAVWEYKIANPSDYTWDDEMKRYGDEGWELVAARRASSSLGTMGYEMIFKRRKQ